MTIVGSGDLKFEPVPNWEQLPPDVPLTEAIGVAVDSSDRVYIFNRGDPPVIVLDCDGRFLNAWGTGHFQRPHGIWISADDTLYLVDDIGHSVQVFSGTGSRLRSIGPAGTPSESGTEGFDHRHIRRGAPPYNLPTNAVTAPGGATFVADGYGNARIHHFSADGELLHSWGEPGDGPGQFRVPHGLGIDRSGQLYVADRENSRIQKFGPDGSLLETWTDVVRPCQVFVAADQLVYVAELGNHNGLFPWMERPADSVAGRVSIFDLDGNLLSRWGGGYDARRVDAFYAAHDIWVDSAGSVYVGEVARTAARNAGEDTRDLPTLRKFVRR